ncbi:unnamed protein product [Hymenolepis diminuta]|uniref:Vesicle-fusing ATPase n=1 Tax=Hymenolepis diminuta TaxID=6216 RepID=A0A0R3SQD2_HYMDI|nr:unnamed protein product [Hymenolepis diminuta]
MHLEIAFGTDEANRRYCTKEHSTFEINFIPPIQPRKFTKLYIDTADVVATEIINSTPLEGVITKYPGSFLKGNQELVNRAAEEAKATGKVEDNGGTLVGKSDKSNHKRLLRLDTL